MLLLGKSIRMSFNSSTPYSHAIYCTSYVVTVAKVMI